MVVRIIAQNSGAGLRKDMGLLASVLKEEGYQVEELFLTPPNEREVKRRNLYERVVQKYVPRSFQKALVWLEIHALAKRFPKKVDVNIFLEVLFPQFNSSAHYNLLIPNQEWFKPAQCAYLPWVDLVLCKTREAERAFGALGCTTRFISFTSVDSFSPNTNKDYCQVLHFAGNGLTKGTKALLNVWSKHPEWPDLWISQRKESNNRVIANNIHYFDRFMREEELPELQTRCGIYVGPSEAEGFGHALVEAMSAKTIVITTDAPPMNEVVRPERGVLVSYQTCRPRRLGTSYYVDETALEQAILNTLSLSESEKLRMGEVARKWYLENDKFFREAITDTLKEFQWLPKIQEERQLYGDAR